MLQQEVVCGTMLGDACIHPCGRYQFKQKGANHEYVEALSNLLNPFSSVPVMEATEGLSRVDGQLIRLQEKTLVASRFQTITHPIFKSLREVWYPEDTKKVPGDLELNARSIAYWYMDDGSNSQSRKTVTLCTNAFSDEDIDLLVSQLVELGFKCTTPNANGYKIIAIGSESYFDFLDYLRPYVTYDCMKYKIDTSKVKETRPGWGAGKLDKAKAREIRKLYFLGDYTQSQLAAEYQVTQGAIWKILRNKSYPEPNISFTGSAIVQMRDI